MVTDLNPGPGNSTFGFMFGSVGNTLLFTLNQSATGTELWSSDGTAAGTQLVRDILPGAQSSSPANFTSALGKAFFQANDGTSGVELWSTDGTALGTARVRDIQPGAGSSSPSTVSFFGGALYLSATSPNGRELWRSDGSEEGTYEVEDINRGAASGASAQMLAFGPGVVLVADDVEHGAELWRSDGTPQGTTLTKDILPGAAEASISWLTRVGDVVFFNACSGPAAFNDCELWKSDGTEAGTVLVKDIRPGPASSLISNLVDVNGVLFFSAVVQEPSGLARRLWKSDGTAGGTIQVGNASSPGTMAAWNGKLYFQAVDAASGAELWTSDGTPDGTFVLKDIHPGANSSSPSNLVPFNGKLMFTATNGVSGRELWETDGTPEGTVMLVDLRQGVASTQFGFDFRVVGDYLYFVANPGQTGAELWRTDGTAVGTSLVFDIAPGPASSVPANFAVLNDRLYFDASDPATGREIWWTMPTATGTEILRDFDAGPPSSRSNFVGAPSLVTSGHAVLFNATDGFTGLELWRTDDTGNNPNNIVMIQDIALGAASSQPESFTRVKKLVFFTANDAEHGRELWVLPAFGQNLPEAALEHLPGSLPFLPQGGPAWTICEMLERAVLPDHGGGEALDIRPEL
jgi:ELWxxDGT repeat protein